MSEQKKHSRSAILDPKGRAFRYVLGSLLANVLLSVLIKNRLTGENFKYEHYIFSDNFLSFFTHLDFDFHFVFLTKNFIPLKIGTVAKFDKRLTS